MTYIRRAAPRASATVTRLAPRASGRSALGCALLFALACVINPVTGRQELSTLSTSQEIALGRKAAEQVESEIGLVREPALDEWLAAVGARLARFSPRRDVVYRFAVADMPEPNAFALPGGWIYVSRGLLAIANSEAEIANVLGHEVGHVAALHAAQRQTRGTLVGLGTLLGAVVAGAAGGGSAAQEAAQLGQLVGAGLIASYSRDQERQADQIGQELAAAAGWDPTAMASFLDTLDRWSTLATGQRRMPTFLDSHPVTVERVRATAARARTLEVRTGAHAGEGAFPALLDGLAVGPDPAQGIFRSERFLHPDLDFTLAFPTGWQTVNQSAAVAARAPDGSALLVLESQGPTGDPREAARWFLEKNQLPLLESSAGSIGGMASFHALSQAQSGQGPLGVDLTWIAHPRAMLRITGLAAAADFPRQAPVLQRTARSLRTLSAEERASFRERLLRVVQARGGESLAELSRRTGNVWSVAETAVANGLAEGQRLAPGRSVKVVIEVSYRGSGG